MSDEQIVLARVGYGTGIVSNRRCPACAAPYGVVKDGVGLVACPSCDSTLNFRRNGEAVEVVKLEKGDGLTPLERRLAREAGLTVKEMLDAKRQT